MCAEGEAALRFRVSFGAPLPWPIGSRCFGKGVGYHSLLEPSAIILRALPL